MQDLVFREYDIRGKVGTEFCIDQVYSLTKAILFYCQKKDPELKTIAIGMDGRISSPIIKDHVVAACRESGLDVVFIGVCPTPVLYFAMQTLPVQAGFMITASHNPKEYNGIKLVLGTTPLWGKQIQEIRYLYHDHRKIETTHKGSYAEHLLNPIYIQWLAHHFTSLKNMRLSAVIDCGNGATATIVPKLIKVMNWQSVSVLFGELDGTYPNHEPDPVVEENMADVKEVLLTTPALVGVGLDGDGDRMAAMTKLGFLIPGDQLLALFAQDVSQNIPRIKVVFDVKASTGLIELLERWHLQPIMSACGHALIKDAMKKNNALLGGELSCHFFFADRYFGYDDGIYAMMRLFEIVVKTGTSLEELLAIFPKRYSSPEFRIACAEEQKPIIMNAFKKYFEKASSDHLAVPAEALCEGWERSREINTVDGLRVTFEKGWGLIRPSNTQAVLSMRFEGNTAHDLDQIKQTFKKILANFISVDF